jgi:hypothetical protein
MTRPADHAEVVCPRCGTVFTTTFEPLTDHEPDALLGGEPTACPECGAVPEPGDRLLAVAGAAPAAG